MSKRLFITAIAVAAFGGSAPLFAQDRSVVTNADLDAAIGRQTTRQVENQRVVRDFLETERVRTVTASFGARTEDLTAGIADLDAATLARIAEAVRNDERVLAGGDTIVISTTAVIIGLLILILLTD